MPVKASAEESARQENERMPPEVVTGVLSRTAATGDGESDAHQSSGRPVRRLVGPIDDAASVGGERMLEHGTAAHERAVHSLSCGWGRSAHVHEKELVDSVHVRIGLVGDEARVGGETVGTGIASSPPPHTHTKSPAAK